MGKAWARDSNNKGLFLNLKVNKKMLMDIPEDDYGDICLTAAPLREPEKFSLATHIVYEDSSKNKKRKQ